MTRLSLVITYTVVLFFILLTDIKAQTLPPNWSVDPANYQYSMTVTAVLKIDYRESTDTADQVAAFINNEVRGVARPVYEPVANRYLAYLMVYANEPEDSIHFQLYDASQQLVKDVASAIAFVNNSQRGTPTRPYVIAWPSLSSQAEILRFEIPGQVGQTAFADSSIQIYMPQGTDLTALTPSFELSEQARFEVNGVPQISDSSTQNFSQPVRYMLISGDESRWLPYTVAVDTLNTRPQQIIATNVLTPNGDGKNDYWRVDNPAVVHNYELFIYNPRGQLVYHTHAYQNNWNGTANGRQLPTGVYYYLFKKGQQYYKGTITLLRK